MKTPIFAILLTVTLALSSCSSVPSAPQFSPWLGASEEFVGKGGTETKVDGMSVWEGGAPSRKLKLLGYIQESAQTEAPVSQIVAMARAQGGDTIVHIRKDKKVAYWAVYKYVK